MTPHSPDPKRRALGPVGGNLLLAIGLAGAANAFVFMVASPTTASTHGGPLLGEIPGWVIGLIWTTLFACLGINRGRLIARSSATSRRAAAAVLVLLIACTVYPLYTFGLQWDVVGLLGNIVTIILALWAAWRIASVSRFDLIGSLATISWLIVASIAIVDENRWLW